MKKILSFILIILMLLSVLPLSFIGVSAETATSGTTGECTWTLDGTKLIISGQGKMGNHNMWNDPKPWPDTITEVVIEEGVTEIGGGSFAGCTNIESLSIPKSVISVEMHAFKGTKINNLYIEDLTAWCSVNNSYGYFNSNPDTPIACSENVYINGELITDLNLPNSVSEISGYAFYGFKNLTNLTMSDNLVKIGAGAFQNCINLSNVYVSKNLESVGDSAFKNCTGLKNVYVSDMKAWCGINFSYQPLWYDGDQEMLEDGVCYANPLLYAENLIFNDKVVTELKLSEGTTLGTGAFRGYKKLKKVTFSKNFASISDAAFWDCTSLSKVIMKNNVTYIGEKAFSGCTALTDVQLSGKIKNIGLYAFYGCKKLKNVWYGGTTIDKKTIEFLDVGPYDYDEYLGYKYLLNAAWYYNTCLEHAFDKNDVCAECGSSEDSATLAKVSNKWLLYVNGKRSYKTTLVKFQGKWFYVYKGEWNKYSNTVVKYKGKLFYIKNGKWKKDYKGLGYYDDSYYYFKNGKGNTSKTGFVSANGHKYFVKKGKVVYKNTLVKYNGKYYYLDKGKKTDITTIKKLDGKWHYIKNGKWSKEKAIVRYVPQRVKIKEGVYIYSWYLANYKGELFYVNNGYAQLDFTGKVNVKGKTYKIKNGIVV